ncbi:MAG: hypothetical protein ACRD5B_03760 [Nitrososphaeraceae archaeon]
MLLYQDISSIGKSAELAAASYVSTSNSVLSSSDPADIAIVYPNNDQTTNVNTDLEISGTCV